ncbi:hypothetical protein NTH42_000001, partial [Vibrio fluvialis]|nr:hypothetical protein [Vibrio fluvialis]
MSILHRLKTDTESTLDELANDVIEVFTNWKELGDAAHELDELYLYLREQPLICRRIWDKLITRHNKGCLDKEERIKFGDLSFPAPCCCCGVDPYLDNSQISPRLDSQQKSLMMEKAEGIVTPMAEYRELMHLDTISPAKKTKKKQMATNELLSYLTSENEIDIETSDYLYGLLQKNECISERLFALASSMSVLSSFNLNNPNPFESQVVSAIRTS